MTKSNGLTIENMDLPQIHLAVQENYLELKNFLLREKEN
jgi:hypothetical protein